MIAPNQPTQEFPNTDAIATDKRPLLNTRGVATRLAIGARKAWLLINSGTIRSVRIGRSVRVDPADLDEFIRAAKSRRAAP